MYISPLPGTLRSGYSSILNDKAIVVFGGLQDWRSSDSTFLYDPISDKWDILLPWSLPSCCNNDIALAKNNQTIIVYKDHVLELTNERTWVSI